MPNPDNPLAPFQTLELAACMRWGPPWWWLSHLAHMAQDQHGISLHLDNQLLYQWDNLCHICHLRPQSPYRNALSKHKPFPNHFSKKMM
jgi:hypothetical protein